MQKGKEFQAGKGAFREKAPSRLEIPVAFFAMEPKETLKTDTFSTFWLIALKTKKQCGMHSSIG